MELDKIQHKRSGVLFNNRPLPDLVITLKLSSSEEAMVAQLAKAKYKPTEGLRTQLGNYQYEVIEGKSVFTIFAETQIVTFGTTNPRKIVRQLIEIFTRNLVRLFETHCS